MKNLIKKATLLSVLALSSIAWADDYKNTQPVKNVVEQKVENKIVVQQFLWHKCIHCYKLEESLDKWLEVKPAHIEFERIPVIWSAAHEKDALYYNYAKTLAKTGKINDKDLTLINNQLFNNVFIKQMELTSVNVLPIFEPYGIKTVEELDNAVSSFVASTENVKGKKLTNEYGISGVPMFVVNGKYIVGFQTLKDGAVTPENLFKTIEEVASGELEKNKSNNIDK